MTATASLFDDSLQLLKQLIATPSFSREEEATAALLFTFLQEKGYAPQRQGNNVWLRSADWRDERPTLLLNSHHDTVKPAQGWTLDPFSPTEQEDRLHGLGSNDAGGPLVALLAAFRHLETQTDRPYNLIWAATAEEEISGKNGIESLLPTLGPIALGIVGEPTQMQMAIAEKGLMVLDGTAYGQAGHAARDEGDNAIYHALRDVEWFRTFEFPDVSPHLGKVKMSVTQIEAGSQHNVVPDRCRFVVDVRTTECYSNLETLEIIRRHVRSDIQPRSTRLNPSGLPLDHPVVQRGLSLGLSHYGSPTLSDQALMPFPTLKIGPGDSARSHTADEFIRPSELQEGIDLYIRLLEGLAIH
ncbi:acetylornithine deacetylase [Catalinimonas alkaloidigena]|uniref:Acetylornithine deacetylase n=1 Tax=Catalinimonas alkaloidigena TaxID=1075417 RepID=A0A1G9T426_9BACT|nr:M20 family metallo-hydrolase [Catalinimonas alkaloidigena]SDM42367.1 acetylornithine deacetylase [Catalinimonas alkaloidigena]